MKLLTILRIILGAILTLWALPMRSSYFVRGGRSSKYLFELEGACSNWSFLCVFMV